MLSLEVPKEYMDFIDKHGIISKNGIEIYGLIDNIDNNLLPSVIAATKLYKEDYNVYLDKREKIANSFNEWFLKIINEYEININE